MKYKKITSIVLNRGTSMSPEPPKKKGKQATKWADKASKADLADLDRSETCPDDVIVPSQADLALVR